MLLDHKYLEKGLTCMSRSITKSVWPAHFGAAVIAAYYFVKENTLSPETVEAVQAQVDLLIKRHEAFFQPYSLTEPHINTEEAIISALQGNIHKLCDIGHNVIYSALALKALRDAPQMQVSAVTEGLQSLIKAFDTIRFGMYIGGKGKRVQDIKLTSDDKFSKRNDVGSIVDLAFSEFLKFEKIYDLDIHKAQVGHVITHAHALVELSNLGYPNLWKIGITPFKIKLKILRDTQEYVPPPKWVLCTAAQESPLATAYWKQSFEVNDWDFGHTFKYNYSFHNLIQYVSSIEKKERCLEHFRHLI